VPGHLRAAAGQPGKRLPVTFLASHAWSAPIKAIMKSLLLALLSLTMATDTAWAEGTRVRDLVMIAGARDNQLVGYGLVAGLAGDGDKDQVYTKQSVANMLQRYGINLASSTISAKNVAVVMVTADIPAFAKPGSRIDVTVASMGDAKTLQGGVLLQTPLLGADNKVYAVAQGALSIGGFTAGEGGAGGATVTKNHPTTGQIINGALVEREIPTAVVRDKTVELLLREPSFTSAALMATAINTVFTNSAHAADSTSVQVQMPDGTDLDPVGFIARLENVEVTTDVPVAYGNLTISVASSLDVSQPSPFSSGGTTQVTPRTDTKVTETKSSMIPLPELPTVEKVAQALNTLGATPRDMMAIFQAMKQAGALQAELIIK
jgi:flagellar P-ring protein precursor FlgI